MATFASAIPSSFGDPNQLFNPMMVDKAVQSGQRNALLMDSERQTMARQADVDSREHVAQSAGYLMSLPADQRPAAYKSVVEWSRANGHPLPNAPAEYPGDQYISMLQSQGIPAAEQYKMGGNQANAAAYGATLGLGGGAAPASGAPAATGASATAPADLMPHFQEASARTGIPVATLVAQAQQESSMGKTSPNIMQVLDSTARDPGFGMTGVDPATLRDPRANINFGADYLKARSGGGDMANPAVRDAALKAYNGGGDPNYVANVGRYLPGQATPGGVAARTGGVDVAGPGAGSPDATPAGPQISPVNGLTPQQEQETRAALSVRNPNLPLIQAQVEKWRDDNRTAARDAAAEATKGVPSGYRMVNGKAERIPGLPTDPQELEAQANAGKATQRQFEQENTLRDEFQKLTGDFRIVQTSYENIRQASKAQDGAGDMSLLYNYVRLLDPTSVVRESEFAAAAASGNLGQRVQTAYERIASGARMPDTLRQSFIREGKNLYDTQLKSHNTVADQYETLAKRNGLEADRVVTRFARPQEDGGSVTVKTPEDAAALKPGTSYTTPDGRTFVR